MIKIRFKDLPRLCLIIAACLCHSAMTRAEITLLAAPDTSRPSVAGMIAVRIYFINESGAAASFVPPSEITARLTRLDRPEEGAQTVILRPVESAGSALELAGGNVRILPYHFRLPVRLKNAGNASLTLDLPDGGGHSVLVRLPAGREEGARPSAAVKSPAATEQAAEKEMEKAEKAEKATSFLANFSGYEPTYFLYGGAPANAKIQVSFKYRFVNPEGELAQHLPWFTRLHLGYTQTAFWDLAAKSRPFTDTIFQPALFYQYDLERPSFLPAASHLRVSAGFEHQSNGKDGIDSRSLNLGYIEPEITFPLAQDLNLNLRARGWVYLGDLTDNPDIGDFRGNGLIAVGIGDPNGLMLTSELRGNPAGGKGNFQIDLSYPLNRILFRNLDLYVFGQLYSGYGESLIDYNRKDTRLRFGIALQR